MTTPNAYHSASQLERCISRCINDSKTHHCTQYVNAIVRLDHEFGVNGGPLVPHVGYVVSNWFTSESTVYMATYGKGHRTVS